MAIWTPSWNTQYGNNNQMLPTRECGCNIHLYEKSESHKTSWCVFCITLWWFYLPAGNVKSCDHMTVMLATCPYCICHFLWPCMVIRGYLVAKQITNAYHPSNSLATNMHFGWGWFRNFFHLYFLPMWYWQNSVESILFKWLIQEWKIGYDSLYSIL